MSWKPEVVADRSGEFCSNALRFATKKEAEQYVLDLSYRWTLVTKTRVVECEDAVSAKWENGQLAHLQV